MQVRQCHYRMPDGRLCRAAPLLGEDFCLFHHPDREQEAAEVRKLGGLRRKRERAVAGVYEFQGLTTVGDIRRLLEVAALDTLSLENSVARARTLAYLVKARCRRKIAAEERPSRLPVAKDGPCFLRSHSRLRKQMSKAPATSSR